MGRALVRPRGRPAQAAWAKWTMEEIDEKAAEQTYRAIGRFMFEFSQFEYGVRHYLGQAIGINEEYFSAVVESYDVVMLVKVAKEVFKKARKKQNAAEIERLLNEFLKLNGHRIRVAHGLWVPFMDGGTVHHVSRDKLSSLLYTDQAKVLEQQADTLIPNP